MYGRIEAEESLIGCLLIEESSIEKVYGILSPEMFESEIYGRVYHEYQKAFDEHKPLTFTELQQNLEAAGMKNYEIEDALDRATRNRAMPFQIVGHAHAILNRYKKSCVSAILDRMDLKDADIEGQIDSLIADLENIRGGVASNGQTVADITKQFASDYFCDKERHLILLGEEGIDNLTGGFQGGDLSVLAARPGVGKSALAMQWAWNFAGQGYKVGYYNCEMQEQALLERFIASKSGIPTVRIRLAKAFLNDEEARYNRAVNELLTQDKIVIFTGAKKVSDIRSDMRDHKFDILIIDYLQLLICADRYKGNRVSEVGELSRELKDLAMSFNIPILALSQLNRASEGRQNKEPLMSEIRESGSIEQDASIIFIMWDKDTDDRSQKGFKTEKSRNGVCARYDLVFDGPSMKFKGENQVSPFEGR